MAFEHIGIISIGEMGYHWAKLLKSKGVEVLSCLDGRSAVTKKRAENAGVQTVPSLAQLISKSDLIVSVVVPTAAIQVAEGIAKVLPDTDKKERSSSIQLSVREGPEPSLLMIRRESTRCVLPAIGEDRYYTGCSLSTYTVLSRYR